MVATPKLICCVLRDQIVAILSQQPQRALTTNEICQKYAECHRTPLNPKDFGYADLKELFCDMNDLIEVSFVLCVMFKILTTIYIFSALKVKAAALLKCVKRVIFK